jgi:transposase
VKPEDIDRLDDTAALKAMLRQLMEMVESLQATVETLQQTIIHKDEELSELRRLLFGRKSERLPSVQSELKKRRSGEQKRADREKTKKKRDAARKAKKELPTEELVHEVNEDDLHCPHCGGTDFVDLTDEVSFEYEFIPSRLVRRKHLRRKKACRCGQHIVTAPAPARVSDGVQYGPGFHAHVVVSKCLDSLPLYRQSRALSRAGVDIGRSSLCDLFHRAAELLEPLHKSATELIKASKYVRADETPQPVLDKDKTHRGYMWNFNTDELVAYVFSPGRSGETPVSVLGETPGFLQADAYSGYNRVTTPKGRTRVGCWAHVRRKFFQAKDLAPEECKHALDTILELYKVEYQAAEENILGSDKHLAMRKSKSKKIVEDFQEWLKEQKGRFAPQSRMGRAVRYPLNHWESLKRFLEDAKLPLDNNMSERLLRVIALGRKNFLFVGNNGAGHNLAVLQSLVSSCQINGVDPQAYLTDVLIRIQTHPQPKIDELLPHRWQPP